MFKRIYKCCNEYKLLRKKKHDNKNENKKGSIEGKIIAHSAWWGKCKKHDHNNRIKLC